MLRPVRGVLCVEGVQTGDGRLIVEGALTWVDPPLPLGVLLQEQHGNMSAGGPQIGTIDTITRNGNSIDFTGSIDDENVDGAEAIRRMEAEAAPMGTRWGVSIDPDDWEIEIILADPEIVGETDTDDEMTAAVVASGAGRVPSRRALAGLVAAAGDGEPEGGEVLWEDAADSIIERYTRLRARGATCCSIPAFAEGYCELDGEAPAAEETVDDAPVEEAVAAAASGPALLRGLRGNPNPSREVFADVTTEPDGSLNIDDERFSGYIATWETCHTGYPDVCLTPPRETDYVPFHHGAVVTEEGERIPTGMFTWGIPHADLSLSMIHAQVHYADSTYGFGQAVIGANRYGIWHAGALMPGITADDVRRLRALSMSGDWRYEPRTAMLRMIASLAVNFPGYPVPRRGRTASLAASGGVMVEPSVRMDGDTVMAMVAAGIVQPAGGACSCGGGHGHTASGEVAALIARERAKGRDRLNAQRTAAARTRLASR